MKQMHTCTVYLNHTSVFLYSCCEETLVSVTGKVVFSSCTMFGSFVAITHYQYNNNYGIPSWCFVSHIRERQQTSQGFDPLDMSVTVMRLSTHTFHSVSSHNKHYQFGSKQPGHGCTCTQLHLSLPNLSKIAKECVKICVLSYSK